MKYVRFFLLASVVVLVIGFLLPQKMIMPVEGATRSSYNQASFWYFPWGNSITHKGVDIFAQEGTPIFSSTSGVVLYTGENGKGGNVVLVLGPKWRLHYYAHLKDVNTTRFNFVAHSDTIGWVGATGNAQGKPAHLHYAIVTWIPYPWRIDQDIQGWRKMFYLNPIEYLNPLFETN